MQSGQSLLFQLLRLLLLLSLLFMFYKICFTTVVPDDDHVSGSQEPYEEPSDEQLGTCWVAGSV